MKNKKNLVETRISVRVDAATKLVNRNKRLEEALENANNELIDELK